LTKAQYDDYSAKVSQYNEAMKLAMNNNLNQPKWSDFEKGDGPTVINDLQRQITAKQMTVPTETQIVSRAVGTGARQAAEPTVTNPEPQFVENVQNTTGETLQQRYAGEGDGTSEKSGSSLLVPGLIIAGGIIAAVLLTKKSKKRR
jgi:hypothetical protein